ncbi:MBOAT, membrane-bound O-acyltransferase family-domain-containing protein [Pelagophyceae sp. CCMP2097]|nr:MBOAT, membrane-bound O-acyltransferase family-domain-containing protein [Pelagophyceae sp. CCMP2097]
MKLTSWAHTNSTLRRTAGDEPASPKTPSARGAPAAPHGNEYPLNLRAADLAMFYAFPTLVYQTAYPRTPRVRRAWLAKRCLELALVLAVMALVVTQLVLPKVAASYAPVDSGDVADVFGSVLALAVPSLSVWMLMFVALFEIWLNIVAEATRFGDRLFYRDWWNASKFDEYWRLWNVPVHNWLVRHVFYPILDAGYSKPAAMIAVFFVSASLHEVLVSAPCHVLRLYAFAGMMAQIPLIYLTNILADKFPKSRVGNVLFWCTFCVFGQPLCLMIYFHDSVEAHAAAAPLAQAVHALANLTATGEL